MRIILKHDRKLYVLEKPVPEEEPPSSAPKAERDAYKKHVDDANEIACLMLATMNSELQKQHENMAAFDMIEHLKMFYQEQARHERFEVSKTLFQGKLAEGALSQPEKYSARKNNRRKKITEESPPCVIHPKGGKGNARSKPEKGKDKTGSCNQILGSGVGYAKGRVFVARLTYGLGDVCSLRHRVLCLRISSGLRIRAKRSSANYGVMDWVLDERRHYEIYRMLDLWRLTRM
ncbi:hypothetical protein KIW84_065856 [Lathyrus oleraceus]|uniref:Uncharacterized protein n=1 Tax=Pisum sativum TaxID=3888 RepID=A0A9D5AAU1_PEA|nr:hypothetical protein KIW84_065856 [Pisum sativum]